MTASSTSNDAKTDKNGRGQPHRKRTLSDKRYKKDKYPKRVEAQRAKWRDPAYREKMRRFREYAKLHPERYTRKGVPDGMTRKEANVLWDTAREKANAFMKEFEDLGIVSADVVVPDSDEGKAKAALHEACVMALGPTDARTKMQAIRTVLDFTKEKPTQKIDQALSGPEEWLKAAIAASKAASDGQQS